MTEVVETETLTSLSRRIPALIAAGRILSAAILLAPSGFLPFSLKDGNTQSFGFP
jgi:hypothetical protein